MRTITTNHPAATRALTPPAPDTDLRAWFEAQAAAHPDTFTYLLAHADDGVVWGRLDGDPQAPRLILAHDVIPRNHAAAPFCPPLRSLTLQEARLFGPRGQLHLWRDAALGLNGTLILDSTVTDATWTQTIDERYLLWGTVAEPIEPLGRHFTHWQEGAQGLHQVLPVPPGGGRPTLRVRHYLAPTGPATIAASRLFDFVR